MRNVSLQVVQHDVACAALTGVELEQIEERVIGLSSCSDEEKQALRLYAWSFLSRFELRRMALERLQVAQRARETDDAQPRLAGWGSQGTTPQPAAAEGLTS